MRLRSLMCGIFEAGFPIPLPTPCSVSLYKGLPKCGIFEFMNRGVGCKAAERASAFSFPLTHKPVPSRPKALLKGFNPTA